MVKAEIPRIIAEKTGYTQKDVKKVLVALEDLVMETLENNEEVRLFNGLKLFIKDRQPIQTRNPKAEGHKSLNHNHQTYTNPIAGNNLCSPKKEKEI